MIGRELADPATHDASAQHRDPPDLARRRLDSARVLLQRVLTLEQPDQVLRGRRGNQLADDAGLVVEPLGQRMGVRDLDRFDRPERSRVVLRAHAPRRALAGLADDEAAQRRGALDHPGHQRLLPAHPGQHLRRPVRGRLLEQRESFPLQIGGRDHQVHQADFPRPPGVQPPAGEDDVQRGGQSDEPGEPLRTSEPRDDAELDFRQSDPHARVVGRDAKRAGQRQLRAAPQAGAADGAGGRRAQIGDLLEHGLSESRSLGALVRIGHARDLVHVHPGDEHPGLGAGEQHPSYVGALRHLVDHVAQVPQDVRRQLVDLLAREVEDDVAEAVRVDPVSHALHHGHVRSTTIAPPCPPPMHSVASPRSASRRSISLSRVRTSLPPLAPTG